MNKNQNFYFLWLFHLFNVFGSEIIKFCIPIWIFQQDNDIINFSIYTCVGILPRVVFSIFAGSTVDLLNKKNILYLISAFTIILSTILMLNAMSLIAINVFGVCGIIFFIGSCCNIIHIASLSFLPVIVEKNSIQKFNSLMMVAESSAAIMSPVFAGLLMNSHGFQTVTILNIVLTLISLIFLIKIKYFHNLGSPNNLNLKNFKKNIKLGFYFILRQAKCVMLLITISLVNFLFCLSFVFFLPLVLLESSNNSLVYGLVCSLASFGQIVGSLTSGFLLNKFEKIHLIFICIIILGVLGPVFISFKLSVLCLGIGYFFTLTLLAIINNVNFAVWSEMTPLKLQGTVIGIRRTISSCIAPLGILLAPYFSVGDFFINETTSSTYQVVFFVCGCLITLVGLAGMVFYNQFSKNHVEIMSE